MVFAFAGDSTITSFAMVLFSYIINSQPDVGGETYRNAKGSPTRGNNNDCRQWRIQGIVVGAAASRTRVHLHEANAGSRNPALASVSETERFNST